MIQLVWVEYRLMVDDSISIVHCCTESCDNKLCVKVMCAWNVV